MLLDRWRFDEPTGGNRCARMSNDDNAEGEWKDINCSARYAFICKKRALTISVFSNACGKPHPTLQHQKY